MGCRLCGLQKPEEQYRLLYEVCQVTAAFILGSGRVLSGQLPGREREVSARWGSGWGSLTSLHVFHLSGTWVSVSEQ